MPYFVMTRKGQFKPSHDTNNQCVKVGKQIYDYELKLLFEGNVELDDNGFIIRHEEIDELIQKMELSGSCEQMNLQISKEISQFFMFKLIGLKSMITPPVYKHEILIASVNYCWVKENNLLSLLN